MLGILTVHFKNLNFGAALSRSEIFLRSRRWGLILRKNSVIVLEYSEKVCNEVEEVEYSFIQSRDNKLVKSVRKLMSSAKERRNSGIFVLEGLRLCADAALNGYSVDTLIVAESVNTSERLEVLASSAKTLVKVPDSLFSYMCDTVSPQGIMCTVKFSDILHSVNEISDGRFVILENTADPANLGAIARTAEALGLDGLIVSSNGCDPFSPKSQRAGMGALLRLPIYITDDPVETVKALIRKGFSVYASVVSNADSDVRAVVYGGKCAVLIGNEANGLSSEISEAATRKITITMRGRAESLNAAAAASVIMWEMTRGEV